MGAKLAWKIIAPNPSWAQIALWKKYFRGPRLRCLDHPKESTKSHLSILLSKIAPMINSCAHWVPGNGKKMQVWKGKIMNPPHLVDAGNFTTLRNWMEAAHIHMLWDLSDWTKNYWTGWKRLPVPSDLEDEWTNFKAHLHGLAPLHANRKDARGWENSHSGYTVKQGYFKFLERPNVPPNPAPWAGIWNFPSNPKIDHFCWILSHQKNSYRGQTSNQRI